MESGHEKIIDPPPDRTYGSYEEALDALTSHGMQHGYCFRLYRSRPTHSAVKTRYSYECDKSGTYRSQATIRSTGTRKTGCPFKLVIFNMKTEEDEQANDQWRLEVTNSEHNHEPSLHPSAHHVYHKRKVAETGTIQSMTHAGTRPMEILTALRQQDPDTLITAQNIRNDRVKMRTEQLDGRSQLRHYWMICPRRIGYSMSRETPTTVSSTCSLPTRSRSRCNAPIPTFS